MEAHKLYRGRLVDHIHLVVNDLNASFKFYGALMKTLGIELGAKQETFFSFDELFVSTKALSDTEKLTGRTHLAFQAKDQATVDGIYQIGIDAGGKANGAPGLRNYHPGYYACFWLDPDGNNIEVVFHGDAKRNVPAIEIEF